MGRPATDMTGLVVGKYTVLHRVDNRRTQAYWLCRCECGRECEVRGTDLRTRSSGCDECHNTGTTRREAAITRIKKLIEDYKITTEELTNESATLDHLE
jgi:hypothetical protein